MAIHVQIWHGAGNCRITDMTNAGRRGKTCRTLSFLGWWPYGGDETAERSRQLVGEVFRYLRGLTGQDEHTHDGAGDADFDAAVDGVRKLVAAAGLPVGLASTDERTIRGIDAPRRKLRAGIDGVWNAGADEGGVGVYDQTDHYNEPASITHNQAASRAYDLAAKVWDRVRQCETYGEAGRVLRDAGCRLHSYCRMD